MKSADLVPIVNEIENVLTKHNLGLSDCGRVLVVCLLHVADQVNPKDRKKFISATQNGLEIGT